MSVADPLVTQDEIAVADRSYYGGDLLKLIQQGRGIYVTGMENTIDSLKHIFQGFHVCGGDFIVSVRKDAYAHRLLVYQNTGKRVMAAMIIDRSSAGAGSPQCLL